jgi:hypothetical protein
MLYVALLMALTYIGAYRITVAVRRWRHPATANGRASTSMASR